MRLLGWFDSARAVAFLTGYVLLVKCALAPGVPLALLGTFAVAAFAMVIAYALEHRERVHQMQATTEAHQKAQEALQTKVEELERSVKSLTNIVGTQGGWTK